MHYMATSLSMLMCTLMMIVKNGMVTVHNQMSECDIKLIQLVRASIKVVLGLELIGMMFMYSVSLCVQRVHINTNTE